jgi:hypothetical protein
MIRRRSLLALLPAGLLAGTVVGFVQQPATPAPADKENIEAALRLTQAAAAEYAIRVGTGEKPLDLRRTPVLKWSNPEAGHVHGNAYLWTRDGRPLAAGCLFNWFAPRAVVMEHEFQSLAEEPVSATFHGDLAWKTGESGVKFVDLPKAPAPGRTEAQRLLQLKRLAKEFSASGTFDKTEVELRLLPQPVYRYSVPKQGVLTGGLFAFVRATDPEIWVLIEARGKDAATAKWRYAPARMHSMAPLRLRHRGQQVWAPAPPTWQQSYGEHTHAYTAIRFKVIPDFLRDAARPKP